MASERFDELIDQARQALPATTRGHRDPVLAGVFAELAKAVAMDRQAQAVDRLASEVGRLANAVQMRH